MSNERFQGSTVVSTSSSMAINSVLKNTYMLLGMTLVWSAIMAFVAYTMNVGMLSPWLFIGGAIGLQLLIHFTADSSLGILATFLFTGFLGFTMGPFLNVIINTLANGSQLVMIAAGGTGLVFFGLSGYILTTKKDMTWLSGALVAGGMVALVAMIVAMFLDIPAIQLTLCVFFIILSSAMILYQTSSIVHGGETNYVLATVSLYLSVYNLFMTMLQLLVAFYGDR